MQVIKCIELELSLQKILDNLGVDWQKYRSLTFNKKGKKITKIKLGAKL
jgi:hypothetical protein